MTTASGNPSRLTRMKTRSTQGGASKAGKAIDTAWIANHAITT